MNSITNQPFNLFLFSNVAVGGLVGIFFGWYIGARYNAVAALDAGSLIGLGTGMAFSTLWMILTIVLEKCSGKSWRLVFSEGATIWFVAVIIVYFSYVTGALIGSLIGIVTKQWPF